MDHITSHFQHHRMEDYKNQENLIGHLHHLASAVQATEIALRLNPPKSTSHVRLNCLRAVTLLIAPG